MSYRDIQVILLTITICYVIHMIIKHWIAPAIVRSSIHEIDVNPNWIKSKMTCYGFEDIEIILAESNFDVFPYFRITKDYRYQLLIPADTSADDIDEFLHLALIAKMKAKYNVFIPDKSLHYASVLCFILDGGDMGTILKECFDEIEKRKKDNKPIDVK